MTERAVWYLLGLTTPFILLGLYWGAHWLLYWWRTQRAVYRIKWRKDRKYRRWEWSSDARALAYTSKRRPERGWVVVLRPWRHRAITVRQPDLSGSSKEDDRG